MCVFKEMHEKKLFKLFMQFLQVALFFLFENENIYIHFLINKSNISQNGENLYKQISMDLKITLIVAF